MSSGRPLGTLRFCGNRHYVRWWKQMHPGETLRWDRDAAPAANPYDVAFAEPQGKLAPIWR